MDIYTLIHDDHEAAKKKLEQIAQMPESRHEERKIRLEPLKNELLAHNEAEEDTFYAALELHSLTRSDVKNSKHEHHEAGALLEKLSDPKIPAAEWTAKFTEVKAALLHHIEEEETQIFAEAHLVLSSALAHQLAMQMQKLKSLKLRVLKEAV